MKYRRVNKNSNLSNNKFESTIKEEIIMSDLNFTVSYIDASGEKQDREIQLESEPYKKSYEEKLSNLLQEYPPDQAETHILPAKKKYIQDAVASQFAEGTELEYDIAEMINTLDRDIRGI